MLNCITAYKHKRLSSVKEALCASKQSPQLWVSWEIKGKRDAVVQSRYFGTDRNLFSSGKRKDRAAKTGERAKSISQWSSSSGARPPPPPGAANLVPSHRQTFHRLHVCTQLNLLIEEAYQVKLRLQFWQFSTFDVCEDWDVSVVQSTLQASGKRDVNIAWWLMKTINTSPAWQTFTIICCSQ